MSTNVAPTLANLYLSAYEAGFIDTLMEQKKFQKARDFCLSFRFIDGLLPTDNPNSEMFYKKHEDGGMYPSDLKVNDTSDDDGSVTFLGMRIASDMMDGFDIKLFDKRKAFPFKVRNYPHLESNIPSSICYGVYTGQLYRFHRICTDVNEFVKEAGCLAELFFERGYKKQRLLKKFNAFVHNGVRYVNCSRVYMLNALKDFLTNK